MRCCAISGSRVDEAELAERPDRLVGAQEQEAKVSIGQWRAKGARRGQCSATPARPSPRRTGRDMVIIFRPAMSSALRCAIREPVTAASGQPQRVIGARRASRWRAPHSAGTSRRGRPSAASPARRSRRSSPGRARDRCTGGSEDSEAAAKTTVHPTPRPLPRNDAAARRRRRRPAARGGRRGN